MTIRAGSGADRRIPRERTAALALLLGLACGREGPAPPAFAVVDPSSVSFVETEGAIGSFRHVTGARGEYYLPETMGSGCAFLDADGDGNLDVFLVNSAPWVREPDAAPVRSALYRNDGAVFVETTATAGLVEEAYGIGCATADFDGDGDVDLYVTRYGRNALYSNRGDGTFREIASASGVADESFSSSAVFFDADLDGDLDLYVVNYVRWTPEGNLWCGSRAAGIRDYCTPRAYEGAPDALYRNEGDGRFVEATAESGCFVPGPWWDATKGLGVVAADLDGDDDPDLYVANDSTANFLFRNDGRGGFLEVGLESGCAYSGDGVAQAGMGVDAGDADGDGDLDLFVTNLDLETNAYYANVGGRFEDATAEARLAIPSLGLVGFGTRFFDADDDGDLDLFVGNGHILVHVEETRGSIRHAQPSQVFRNEGGVFEALDAGPDLARPRVVRGSVTGDFDGDGRIDLFLSTNGGAPALLRNAGRAGHNAVAVRPLGVRSNREGIGARLRCVAGDLVQVAEARTGGSYASASDPTVHFGPGARTRVDRLEIRWPSGWTEVVGPVAANRRIVVREGSGIVGEVAFRR